MSKTNEKRNTHMRKITISIAYNTNFNELFESLECFPCVITFDNCSGTFLGYYSGILHVTCRQEDYSEINKILKNFV